MAVSPESIKTQSPISSIAMSRRRFLSVLEITALAAATNVLSGCDLIEPNSCSAMLRFYGRQLGNLVRNKRDELLMEDPQLGQKIDFQAREFRGRPSLSEINNKSQLDSAVRGTVLVRRNLLGSGQTLDRETRAELLYLMAYTNQIIDAAKLSREDRHSLTIDQAKAVLIFALIRAEQVYQSPEGKNCFSESTNLE